MINIRSSHIGLSVDRQPDSQIHRLSMVNTIVLHLLPGAMITAFVFLTAPLLIQVGYPPVLSLYLAILLILIPFELGFLFYQGKKLNNRYSLEGIVFFGERLPTRQMIALILILFAWSGFVFSWLPKLDTWIARMCFAWFPSWSLSINLAGVFDQYSKAAITVTILAGFIINGLAGPIVEELYFRGYLLPRIPSSKNWASFINILLFSLYHIFSPWQNLTRILAFLPYSYTVYWKRNIFISMGAHCLLNIAGMAIALAL